MQMLQPVVTSSHSMHEHMQSMHTSLSLQHMCTVVYTVLVAQC